MRRLPHPALLLALVLLAGGCKKKQKTVPAATAQAPTITGAAPPPAETKPEAAPAQPENNPPAVTEPPKAKPKPKPKPVRKPAPKPPAEPPKTEESTLAKSTPPPRIVLQPGSTTPPDTSTTVVPAMAHSEEAHHRFTTEQLMQSTDANVKSLKRVLTADERGILQQIQAFMTQAREAIQTNDLVRAHNLALKAHLLSDELVR